MKDIETKEKFIELRPKGYNYPRISELIGVSERLMVQWNKEFKEDISQRHLQELEILKEKYQLHSEYRTGNEIMQRSLKRNQFIE